MIFKDKVAIVTGGSFGIGRAAARAFTERGAKVVVADCIHDRETINQINKSGGEAIFVECDVSNSADVKMMVERTIDT